MNLNEKLKQIKSKYDKFMSKLKAKDKRIKTIEKARPFVNIFILLLIAVALCSITFTKLKAVIFSHDDNYKTFYALKAFPSLKDSFKFYKDVMQRPWKPRLLSCAAAALFMPKDQIESYTLISADDQRIEIKDYELFYRRVGIWTVFWLFITFRAFIYGDTIIAF